MLGKLQQMIGTKSPLQVMLIGLGLIALVGTADYFSWYELSFSVFYLAPIVLVAWYAQAWAGFVFCGLSALVWCLVEITSGTGYSNMFIPFWNTTVRFGFFVVTAYLLVELKAHLRIEQRLARTDALTGALNARALRDACERLLLLARRGGRSVVLAYIDIDHFKAINDKFGHGEGDRVLQSVVQVLTRCVRASDVVGRIGGDEFAVFLPESDRAAAEIVFNKIHLELVADAAARQWPIGFSIGAAIFNPAPPCLDTALGIADQIMYEVKKSGKNNIVYKEYLAQQWAVVNSDA